MIPIHKNIQEKLDFFYKSNKIPHIIFHGSSGTGKRSIVYNFINKIYKNDKDKIKTNVMFVNCAHGKGIKFIREELKFFAKTNIRQINNEKENDGVLFKTIILLNADYLTIDAQSALRRCIELFSHNTRFFIIVENKNKLLNPILSRFCEIYVPEYIDQETNKILNLHQYNLEKIYDIKNTKKEKIKWIDLLISTNENLNNISNLVILCTQIYEKGCSCLDIIQWIEESTKWSDEEKANIFLCFQKIKSEFRCEKLLIFFILDFLFIRSNKDLKNIYSI
jgi:DNA polymerase III delta prime subunit